MYEIRRKIDVYTLRNTKYSRNSKNIEPSIWTQGAAREKREQRGGWTRQTLTASWMLPWTAWSARRALEVVEKEAEKEEDVRPAGISREEDVLGVLLVPSGMWSSAGTWSAWVSAPEALIALTPTRSLRICAGTIFWGMFPYPIICFSLMERLSSGSRDWMLFLCHFHDFFFHIAVKRGEDGLARGKLAWEQGRQRGHDVAWGSSITCLK